MAKKTSIKNSVKRGYHSLTDKVDLIFPVTRFAQLLRKKNYALRVSVQAGITIASVLESIVREILTPSVEIAREHKKVRINSSYISQAIKQDPDLKTMFQLEQKTDFISDKGKKKRRNNSPQPMNQSQMKT